QRERGQVDRGADGERGRTAVEALIRGQRDPGAGEGDAIGAAGDLDTVGQRQSGRSRQVISPLSAAEEDRMKRAPEVIVVNESLRAVRQDEGIAGAGSETS